VIIRETYFINGEQMATASRKRSRADMLTTDAPGTEKPSLASMSAKSQASKSVTALTLTEITGMVSRQVNLPPDVESVRLLAMRVQQMVDQNPELRDAGPESSRAH